MTVATNERDQTKINIAIQQLEQGRSNATGECTLEASVASTVVAAPNCGAASRVFLTPTTPNAAAEFGNGVWHVSAVENGAFTITHANNGQTDRTFHFVCLG